MQTNASIVRDLASAIGRVAPDAHIAIISNPVNSTVPIVAATLEKLGVFDPRRVFGVTTLDVVRAARFVGGVAGVDPKECVVPVVGGHSGATIVPLLSQTKHGKGITGEQYKALIHRIQFGGDEVVKAKDGAGSATLSMAYAGERFADLVIRALSGEKGIVAPSYVNLAADRDGGAALKSAIGKELEYFSARVEIGPEGVQKILPLGNLSSYEQGLLKAAIPELEDNIAKVCFQ